MSGFSVSAPLLSAIDSPIPGKPGGFNQFMTQTFEENIDMLFKVLVAQSQSVMPGDEGKGMEIANSILSVAGSVQHAKGNHLLEQNNKLQTGMYVASIMGFEGHEVEHESDELFYKGEEREIICHLPPNAEKAVLSITGERGIPIKQFSLSEMPIQSIIWDGKDSKGRTVPEGAYSITVMALNEEGQPVTGSTRIRDLVDGIEFDAQDIPHLRSGDQSIEEIFNYRKPRTQKAIPVALDEHI
jgi:flagellar hook assembly protein FlgD